MAWNFVVLYGNCGIIWKLWYYGMEVVVFIQFSLYGTLFVQNSLHGRLFVQILLYWSFIIAATDCVQVDFSNIDRMKIVIVKWLLWYVQVTVWNIICPNQIIWKFIYYYYRLCSSRFFQYRVYEGCYCGMVVMVCAGHW